MDVKELKEKAKALYKKHHISKIEVNHSYSRSMYPTDWWVDTQMTKPELEKAIGMLEKVPIPTPKTEDEIRAKIEELESKDVTTSEEELIVQALRWMLGEGDFPETGEDVINR